MGHDADRAEHEDADRENTNRDTYDDAERASRGGDTTPSNDAKFDGEAVDSTAVLRLPDALREAFKDPLGPVYTEPAKLLADAGTPILAVGDVVTRHLLDAGVRPDVGVIDWRTEREAVADAMRPDIESFERRIEVSNPAATLTVDLLESLARAIRADDTTVIMVDGEEDLVVLPALVAAPDGASVVYGQPGVGMVRVEATVAHEHARDLLGRMDGDHERAWRALDIEPR